MDKLRLMETYVQIVRKGSFTAAADQLGLSRTAATRHLSHLEELLGVRLLNRNTRHISVTDIGRTYYEMCLRAFHEIDEVENVLADLQSEPCGTLRIAAPKAFATAYLGTAMAKFAERYPNIDLALFLSTGSIDRVKLIDNSYDLAIHMSRPDDSSIIAKKISLVQRVLCASPGYIAKQGMPDTPDGLGPHKCLINLRHTPDRLWMFLASDQTEHTIVRVSGPICSNSAMVLRSAAISGAGIALLPSYLIAQDFKTGRLIRVLEQYRAPDQEVFALYPFSKHVPRKVRLFADFIYEYFQESSWDLTAGEPVSA